VRSRVRIAIITTGSEIVPPGVEPLPGQVFDSNATALSAAIRAAGALPMSREHVADEPALMLAALDGAGGADLIITSGGISMGDHEVVREVLEPRGARVGHVAMQPGGPQATAEFQGVPVVCFPGNPVSTQLSFEVFLAPLLRQLAGLPPARRELRVLGARLHSPSGKRQFLRGRVAGDGIVEVSGAGSHLVAALAASDVLVIVPEDVTMLEAGETVETWAL
jgi:molybdopterin molybdotransferase